MKLPGPVPRRPNIFESRRRQLRHLSEPKAYHHHVYVILLKPEAARLRKVQRENPNRNPDKPCVYVGMTGLTPEERFANHQAGFKGAYVVTKFGIRLLPELFAHLNPMPFEAAVIMERDLAEDLRQQGYTVTGGH
jgi:hypothetical protein